MSIRSLLIVALCSCGFHLCEPSAVAAPASPEITSVFPLVARQGTSLQVEIRGAHLDGTSEVWFGDPSLRARIKKIEDVSPEEAKEDEPGATQTRGRQRALLNVEIDLKAKLGPHLVRLISPAGISKALPLVVCSDPLILENDSPHQKPHQAQLVSFPSVIAGKIRNKGELDYYAFDVAKNQELSFVIASNMVARSGGFDATQLALYEATGSWFDPQRATRLAFTEKRKLSYQFKKSGRYLVEVSSFLGMGGPDSVYRLHIAPADSAQDARTLTAQEAPSGWQERSWNRPLGSEWLMALGSRSQGPGPQEDRSASPVSSSKLSVEVEAENRAHSNPVDTTEAGVPKVGESTSRKSAQTVALTVPVLLEGTIERPGDLDLFKLSVRAGDRLAFEFETPDVAPPIFNPRLRIVDNQGQELFTNIYGRIGGDGDDWVKSIEAKTVLTFQREGEYTLEIRDVTDRFGNAHFAYRLLIRAQTPHIGRVELSEDRINLTPGQTAKLTLVTELEEGFSGGVAFDVENLPAGVRAVPGTEAERETPPPLDEGKKEQFLPKYQKTMVMLLSSENAPLTQRPSLVRVSAWPIVQGKLGSAVVVSEFPLMIIRPNQASATPDPARPQSR